MRIGFLVAASALLAPLGPPWMKLDDALSAAGASDKLVAVYATMGANGERGCDGTGESDAALATKEAAARYGEFHWVAAPDVATAKRVDSPPTGANLIFLNPDGALVGIWNVQFGGLEKVLKALDEAKAQYVPKSVPWHDGEPDLASEDVKKKLVVYAFLDDREISDKAVKALEHPWVARDHGRLIFVRKYVLDSPLAKRFKVTAAPTLIFYDPSMKEGQEVIERRTGDVTPKMVRVPLKKYFERVKKAAADSK